MHFTASCTCRCVSGDVRGAEKQRQRQRETLSVRQDRNQYKRRMRLMGTEKERKKGQRETARV